ncbi:MAG TPA: STAS domain-containing protein [Pyrinomonadaceae bacterium]|jgi:anti-sigma B factor antagonist|nr:STAS domain-containing protein [Pyrinomonadaceae bacterium]
MTNLIITERRSGSVTVLDLKGNIRLGEGNIELHNILRFLVEKGERRVLLNLAEVSYIDSSGLGELVAGYTTLQKHQGELKLLHLTVRVRELMVITKLLTVFDVYDSETEAINSFQPESQNAETEPETLATGKLNEALVG